MSIVRHSWLAAGFSLLSVTVQASAESDAAAVTEELVVVASRLPAPAREIGRSLTVLDAVQISDLGHEYAADLFRYVPGVAVNRAGGYGGIAQLRIRGAEANHSVVLIDGVDVTAAGSGEFDFSSLLAADIEKIEVLRGPSSGLYGSNAIGGVVNILTKRPVSGLQWDTAVEVGANDTRHAALSVAAGSEMVQGRLSYARRRSEFDISENDAVMGSELDEDDNETISGQLRWQLSADFDVAMFARRTDKQTDADGFDFGGGELQGLAVDDLSFSDTTDLTLGATATARLADGRSISRLALARTETDLDGGVFGSESERDQARLDTSWSWREGGVVRQRTTLFVQYEEESFKNLVPVDPSQVSRLSRDFLGYGVEHRIGFGEQLFVNAAVRRDDNDEFDNATTYSLDFAYLLNQGDTRLHGSYGKAVTNPTFFEQFGFVPGTFVGNPNLQPEEAMGWDVGIEQYFVDGALIVDISYFDIDLEDEIQNLFPSVRNAPGTSERHGVEMSASYRPSESLSFEASYTYTDAQEPAGEEVRRPEHTASLSVARDFLQGRARVAASAAFNGEMLDDDFRRFFSNGFAAERTELDSYVLFNLSVSYRVSDGLDVFLRAENLFDETYQEVISYAAPGRSVFGGIRYHFAR